MRQWHFFPHVYSRALLACDCLRKLGLHMAYQHILNIVSFLGSPNKRKSQTICVRSLEVQLCWFILWGVNHSKNYWAYTLIYSCLRGSYKDKCYFVFCFLRPYRLVQEIRCGRRNWTRETVRRTPREKQGTEAQTGGWEGDSRGSCMKEVNS